MHMPRAALLIVLILTQQFWFLCLAEKVHRIGNGWEWWCIGNCNYVTYSTSRLWNEETPPLPGLVLMGGGTDVDAAFQWLISQSGGGHIVILRTSGADGYNDYIYNLGNVIAVSTLLITSRVGAMDPFVATIVKAADALFIAGGDQSTYIALWNNTSIQWGVQSLIQRGVSVGGTSAGLAVLGQYIYTATTGSVTSSEALQNPYTPLITLGSHFLRIPLLQHVITDTHFYQRDRMGRLLTFMARLMKEHHTRTIRGIAVDEQTAVLVDVSSGWGRVVTQTRGPEHVAYFLEAETFPQQCVPNEPLSFANITIWRTESGQSFDLRRWQSSQAHRYLVGAVNGTLISFFNNGTIYIP
jgi:cyanophycinase